MRKEDACNNFDRNYCKCKLDSKYCPYSYEMSIDEWHMQCEKYIWNEK